MISNKKRKIKIEPKSIKKLQTQDITSFFNNSSTVNEKWIIKDSLLIYQTDHMPPSDKVACFDLDGTVITTKSGKVFPKDEHDWKINSLDATNTDKFISKLNILYEEGYKIVIFTNQKGLLMNKKGISVDSFKRKIESILKHIFKENPCIVFVSLSNDYYRKPLIGMWNYLQNNCNDNVTIDRSKSFYVGDAAGRDSYTFMHQTVKKDFSCCDRLFAINIGLENFYTPEEYFHEQSHNVPYHLPSFNPKAFLSTFDKTLDQNTLLLSPPDAQLVSTNKEMVMMVGFPASGKSFFVQKYFECQNEKSHKYIRVNMDTLKSKAKCEKFCKEILSTNKIFAETELTSMIVDNTNPDIASRKSFIDIAKNYKIPVRCFWIDTPFEQCLHNEKYRRLLQLPNFAHINEKTNGNYGNTTLDKQHSSVPELVFRKYR
ncbi:unnamed protein product [Gordionus sp. m RMFG-2023]